MNFLKYFFQRDDVSSSNLGLKNTLKIPTLNEARIESHICIDKRAILFLTDLYSTYELFEHFSKSIDDMLTFNLTEMFF